MEKETGDSASKAAIMRMPAYLRYLKAEFEKGSVFVSSSVIANALSLSAITVRKDLALVSSLPGKPRMGFSVQQLISDLEKFLGYKKRTNAVVVGAGGLGRAILRYEGFENYGLNVIAAFDISPAQIGAVAGKPVYPMARLKEIVLREDARLGILTVPRAAAQEACNAMVDAGIRAIYSLASTQLSVPEGVHIKYEDLAASLAAFSSGLLVSE